MLILDTAAKRVNKSTGRNIKKTAQNKGAQNGSVFSFFMTFFNFAMYASTFQHTSEK